MPDGSADCIVTSPPYWAKRDYLVAGQYGHEPSPAGYVETLRSVFREGRRVLADDGTCWLNLGDSFSSGGNSTTGLHAYLGPGLAGRHVPGLGTKNLLGLPWRVALALQDDGWILRNAIIWHKPNAMPESVRDRMSCRYELIFLLTKSRHYWFDLDPLRIPRSTVSPVPRGVTQQRRSGQRRPPGARAGGRRPGGGRPANSRPPKYGAHARQVIDGQRYGIGRCRSVNPKGRNPGDVWAIPTRPYLGPHFAAFPVEVPTRCIQAGCKPGGVVLDIFCGTGTTGLAALALGRRFTGIELSPVFAALAAERLRGAANPTSGAQ
jgi:DNA modification methylase